MQDIHLLLGFWQRSCGSGAQIHINDSLSPQLFQVHVAVPLGGQFTAVLVGAVPEEQSKEIYFSIPFKGLVSTCLPALNHSCLK